MNAITARTVICIYPQHMMRALSCRSSYVGDCASASRDMNERHDILQLGASGLPQTLCCFDCPTTERVTTDLAGFGQFVYAPERGPPVLNAQYMWRRQSICWNERCDAYNLRPIFAGLPGTPTNLYLFENISRMSLSYFGRTVLPLIAYSVYLLDMLKCPLVRETRDATSAIFDRHFRHYLSCLVANFQLGSPQQLLKVLNAVNGILGGSAALFLFCPTPCWPSNLDFYLPKRSDLSNELTDLFLLQGYCFFLQRSYHNLLSSTSIIHRVELYVHRDSKRVIRVIYANSTDPLSALLNSHSTLGLNYISGTNAVCLYPWTTLQRIGIRLQNLGVAAKLFEKYIERGFILRPQAHPLVSQDIHRIRSLEDNDVLLLALSPMSPQIDSIKSVSWLLPSKKDGFRGCTLVSDDDFGACFPKD